MYPNPKSNRKINLAIINQQSIYICFKQKEKLTWSIIAIQMRLFSDGDDCIDVNFTIASASIGEKECIGVGAMVQFINIS